MAHESRAAGRSKYSLYRLIRLNFDLMTGFSAKPLQFFSLLGVLISSGAVAAYVVVMARRLLAAQSVEEAFFALWDRDVLEFFLIGITLFGIGLVGEYVGRINEQVRGRPRYLVQAVLEARGAPPATASSAYREPARLHAQNSRSI